jgi:ketosteroid isomerase-like protein
MVSPEFPMTPDASTLATQLLDAWNARDLEALLALLDDDIVWYDPGMAHPPAKGRPAVRSFAEAVLRAFPDFQYEALGPVCAAADGSRCVIHWRITASHTAPLAPPGFAPTHRQFRQEGLDLLEARAGRITRILTCFDAIAGVEQLLALRLRPPAGSLRERLLVLGQRLLAARARRLTRRRTHE